MGVWQHCMGKGPDPDRHQKIIKVQNLWLASYILGEPIRKPIRNKKKKGKK